MDIQAMAGHSMPANNELHINKAKSPEEAAKAFETLMVQEFVKVMTENLFKSNLSGEGGPGWMEAQSETQRSVLTEVLTKHLVDQDVFNFDELILQGWERNRQIEQTP